MAAGARGRILLVDDDAAVRRVLIRALKGHHEIVEVSDGEAALLEVERGQFDAILSDIGLPGIDGTALLRAIRERDLDVPVVLMTGMPSVESAISAVEYGALEYLTKPTPPFRVVEAVERAIRLGRIARAKRAMFAEVTGGPLGAVDKAGLHVAFDRTLAGMWPAFQPIVGVDGLLFGYEALLRTTDAQLNNPVAVIDAGEKLGRSDEIVQRMGAMAVAAMRPTPSTLFFNLRPADLYEHPLLSDSCPLLSMSDRVILEITERDAIERLGDVKRRATELRQAGYRIAIDDLGAGYAGLSAFAALEPEVAKIDMGLVRDVHLNPTKRKLIASVASLCHDLGIRTVAEGVESAEELACLVEVGCDLVQGYHIARPGPAFPAVHWKGAAAVTPR